MSSVAKAAEPAALLGPLRVAMLAVRDESGCGDFDDFPNGGMQNLWCHRPPDFTFAALGAEASVPVFLSGPHTKSRLSLADEKTFGHYNPAFVQWLTRAIVPARDDEFRLRSQAIYDHAAAPLVAAFVSVRAKVKAERPCFDREKARYQALLTAGTLPRSYYERWYYFPNPRFCAAVAAHPNKEPDGSWIPGDGTVDGNVAKTVVGFWLRRSIDGTEGDFSDLLDKVIAAYAPDLAKE